jgi:pantothenate kinase
LREKRHIESKETQMSFRGFISSIDIDAITQALEDIKRNSQR